MVDRRGFSGTVVTNALLALCMAITSILIARSFGPEVRGFYAIVASLINLSVTISLLGTQTRLATMYGSMLSFVGPCKFNLRNSFLSVVAISAPIIFCSAPLYLSLFFEGEQLGYETVVFSLASVLASYSICRLQLNLAEANWTAFNYTRLTFAIVLFILVSLSRGVEVKLLEVLYWFLLANFLSVSAQMFLSRPLPSGGNDLASNVIDLYKTSVHYFLNSLAGVSSGYADTLFAALVLSPAAVGFWAVARSISALLAPVNTAVSATIFSAYSRRDERTKNSFLRIVTGYLIFNFIAVILLAAVAPFILVPVFGIDFSPSISLVPIALGFSFMSSTAELCEERLRGDGRPRPVTVSRGSVLSFYAAVITFGPNDLDVVTFSLICLSAQGFRLIIAAVALKTNQGSLSSQENHR